MTLLGQLERENKLELKKCLFFISTLIFLQEGKAGDSDDEYEKELTEALFAAEALARKGISNNGKKVLFSIGLVSLTLIFRNQKSLKKAPLLPPKKLWKNLIHSKRT